MKKIAVVFGGTSSEYEVSLKSASAVLKTLRNLPYEVIMIGITEFGEWLLYQESIELIEQDLWYLETSCLPINFDFSRKGFFSSNDKQLIQPTIIFPVLHGGDGENGAIQGLFEMMQVPFVGCSVISSAISMNKNLLHELAETVGVKSTPTLLITAKNRNRTQIQRFIEENGFPIFVKPNEAGSSKGISKVETQAALEDAVEEAFQFGSKVILQKEVIGIEIGCSILGNEKLIVGECDQINLEGGFFDYTEKYELVTAGIQIPASIDPKMKEKIQEQAKLLYQTVECSGLARIDFFLTKDHQILLNEINTMPGFTDHSRFPMMMKAIGLSYEDIISELIELGVEKYEEKLSSIN